MQHSYGALMLLLLLIAACQIFFANANKLEYSSSLRAGRHKSARSHARLSTQSDFDFLADEAKKIVDDNPEIESPDVTKASASSTVSAGTVSATVSGSSGSVDSDLEGIVSAAPLEGKDTSGSDETVSATEGSSDVAVESGTLADKSVAAGGESTAKSKAVSTVAKADSATDGNANMEAGPSTFSSSDLAALASLDDGDSAPQPAPVKVVKVDTIRDVKVVPQTVQKVAEPSKTAGLMQKHSEVADLSKARTSLNASSEHEEFSSLLSRLEKTILKMAKNKNSYGSELQDFISDMRALLDQKTKTFLRADHQKTSNRLTALAANLTKCNTSAVMRDNDLSNFTNKMQAIRPKHTDCRLKEFQMARVAHEKCRLKHATTDLSNEYCRVMDEGRADKLKIKGMVQCATDGYDVLQEVRKYLQDQFDFWDSQYNATKIAHERCWKARNASDAAKKGCKKAWEDFKETKSDCDSEQKNLEELGCKFQERWNDHCCLWGSYMSCHNGAKSAYLAAKADAQAQEVLLKEQMVIVLRLYCYMGVFSQSNLQAGISACDATNYNNDAQVTALGYSYMAIPQDATTNCGAPYPYHQWPNRKEFVKLYYKNSWDNSTFEDKISNCTASCCPRHDWGVCYNRNAQN
eukprot:TRINITY_DN108864_c0_g1_i1.p1 TRINITY_DN108864_c0_g1~~TRINITY_DN108864_c0_g1_i1.p1  ORF type:complete len:635 (+),score=98.83 TRINITY_DN108864_c0_g1_i1:197-2101(+)